MRDQTQDGKNQERFERGSVDGATALKKRRAKFDVVKPRRRSLVPQSWQRKAGRAGNLVESFYHAFHGVALGLRDQRNLRIHFTLAILVTIAGFAFKIDMISWMALVIVMALVIACEFINTSLEHLVDISANNEYHVAARCAKDTAAAAILAVSFAAMIVGLMIFVPRLLSMAGINF